MMILYNLPLISQGLIVDCGAEVGEFDTGDVRSAWAINRSAAIDEDAVRAANTV